MGTDTTPDPRAVMEPPALEADYYDEDNQPHGLGVRWDLSWGCKVSVSFDVDSPEQLRVTVSMSDEDHRRGITVRATSREQVRAYAAHLLELVGDPQAELEAGETRTEPRKLNELADDMERVLALTEQMQVLGSTDNDLRRDARRLVRKASSELARLAYQAETCTEWGVRLSDGGVNDWGDDKPGAQREAEMYLGEFVQHQVGPWAPVEDEAAELAGRDGDTTHA